MRLAYAYEDDGSLRGALTGAIWDIYAKTTFLGEEKWGVKLWMLQHRPQNHPFFESRYEEQRGRMFRKARCRVKFKSMHQPYVCVKAFRITGTHPAVKNHPQALIFPTLEKAKAWINQNT